MPRRPEPEAPKLSQERILAAAREVIAQDGLASLSMRRLAQELDVWPMSIYRYFRDKEELLDALVESLAAAVPPPTGDGSWAARLSELLTALELALQQQPGELRARFAARAFAPGALPLSEAGLGILRDGGLGPSEAAETWIAALAYTVGFAGIAGGEPGRVALATLDPQLAAHLGAEDMFQIGLRRLLSERAP
jgi:AcrR family transcriptional regulator